MRLEVLECFYNAVFCSKQMTPDVLLPTVTCQAEFVPYFLNLLRDCTAAIWSNRSTSTFTPLKAPTPVRAINHSTHHSSSIRSNDVTPGHMSDERTRSFNNTCTPDSNLLVENRRNSTQRLSSAKSRARVPSDVNSSLFSPQEVSNTEHQSHTTKPDFARHQALRQQNTVILSEYFASSAKERHGHRALFSDGSAPTGNCSARKSAGKHKSSHGNKMEKVEKTPVPLFNLDSNVDFPDMKSSQRYYFL